MSKDFYKILGVDKGATPDQIKKAYRVKANKFHPDKNPDNAEAEAKFKEASEAYETLSDPQKKQMYDQFGSDGPQSQAGFGGGQGQGFGGFDFSGFQDAGGFSDIFETFFGHGAGGRKQSTEQRGEDLELRMSIPFEESIFGVEKKVTIRRVMRCNKCSGSGAEPGTKIVECPECKGAGQIKERRQTIMGQIITSRACHTCKGSGKIPEKPCSQCNGNKRHAKEETITIKVPLGISNGTVIRLQNKGNQGTKEGIDGDLYIRVSVEPSKKFTRNGQDIISEIEIHALQAVLGDEIDVETMQGKEKLTVPPGTQNGKVLKIKGKGVPANSNQDEGDHLVKIIVYTPKKISKKERELYLELAQESGIEIKPGKSGLLW
jgi:molecular chaperone DnaJ